MSRPSEPPAQLSITGRSLLLTAFFLSGAAALIFEVIWTRLLLLSLGATSAAVGAVLGAFMGGMAVGSALAGRSFLARRDPVLTFALLEGWVGLYGLSSPYLLRLVSILPGTLQFAGALVLLLPATVAMGASLPVLVGDGSSQLLPDRFHRFEYAGRVVHAFGHLVLPFPFAVYLIIFFV